MNPMIFSFFHLSLSSSSLLYSDIEFEPIHIKLQRPKFSRRLAEAPQPLIETEEERTPFTADFDLSGVVSGSDPHQCKKAGEMINWSYNENYTCTDKDVVTSNKLTALYNTLQNVKDYMSRLIRVKHTPFRVNGLNDPTFTFTPEREFSFAAHYFYVIIRPFAQKSVAASAIFNYLNTGRPIQSMIMFDPKYLPEEEESEKTNSRYFFNLVFHEMVHSLGMGDDLYHTWINRSTGLPYDPIPVQVYSLEEYPEKEFLQICTPKATQVAQKRLNKNTDEDGYPVCLELEDQGGYGTQYCHPKATIYRQDVMAGIAPRDGVISEVVVSLIEDMGWYTVDWSLAEPMTWGAKEILTRDELKRFSDKPVWKNFPENYLFEPKGTVYLSHDHKSIGKVSYKVYNETLDPLKLRRYGNLYYDTDLVYTNNPAFDFSLQKSSTQTTCGSEKWALLARTNGEDAYMCIQGLLTDEVFSFTFQNCKINCITNDSVKVDDLEIMCPNVTLMNQIVNFLKIPQPDYGHIPLYKPTPTPTETATSSLDPLPTKTPVPTNSTEVSNKSNIVVAPAVFYSIIGGSCLLLVIVLGMIICFCMRRSNVRSLNENSTDKIMSQLI